MDGENMGGGAAPGSAADILGTAAAAGGQGGDPAGGGAAGGASAAEPAGGQGVDPATGGADPDWYANISAEGGDGDNPSLRDWLKGTGVKDLDGLAKIARDNQRALRESGRIKIPGEGATPDEISEFNKAIGVPDAPTDYAITAPKDENGNDLPLNSPLIERLSVAAHKAGLPKAGFEAVVQDYIQAQLDETAQFDSAQKQLAEDTVKSWGGQADAKIAAINVAAKALGIDSTKMVALRNALGADFALNMMAKLGDGMTEDVLENGSRQRFGVSGAEAQAEMDKLKTDTDFQQKLKNKDVAALARWDRLQDAAAEWKARQQQEG